MKKLLLVTLLLTGCVHKTIHQECSDPKVVSKYKDYNQCYSELTKDREIKEARRKEAPLFNFNNSQETHCITNGSTDGNNYTGTTNCH